MLLHANSDDSSMRTCIVCPRPPPPSHAHMHACMQVTACHAFTPMQACVVAREKVAVLSMGTLTDAEMVAHRPDAAYVLAGEKEYGMMLR